MQQHYYVRHRIRLVYPKLKCVMEYQSNGHHSKYYPIELLELFEEEDKVVQGPFYGCVGAAAEPSGKLKIDEEEKNMPWNIHSGYNWTSAY